MDLPHNLHDLKKFRDFLGIFPELDFNSSAYLHDQPQHPPYIPRFHVAGFAPVPVVQIEGPDGGVDFDGEKLGLKGIKEHDFLEINPPISSIHALGLSLDSAHIASSDGSSLLKIVRDDIDRELERHDAEIDRFLKIQGDQLRHDILYRIQSSQHKSMSVVEERVLQKLREKDEELEIINRKNKELEVQIEQLRMEAEVWQQRAKYNEKMISNLNYNLERVYGRPRESIEECGDNEGDDTASCFNGRNKNKTEKMMCRSCGVKEVCMLLLPCKHMCLCKECERKLSCCPLCQFSKILGIEVSM